LLVNEYTTSFQSEPSVRAEADGDFVVAWYSYAQDGSEAGVFARRFSSAGVAVTSELQVNTYTPGHQLVPVVSGAGGAFVVIWLDNAHHDGSNHGVFAQRFSVHIPFDVDGNGVVGPLTDTLLALRYAFGFRGATLISGAVGAGCTRCDAPSIEAYLLVMTN
jgi:hypothetical protein